MAEGCPYHGAHEGNSAASAEQDAAGVWHVRGYAEAKAVLRADATQQAGLGAAQFARLTPEKLPILYLEGEAHRARRAKAAKFFTAGAAERQRAFTEALSKRLVGELTRRGRADLSNLSERLALSVTAQLVGLTESAPGRRARVRALLGAEPSGGGVRGRWQSLVALGRAAQFYLLDVRPAVRARRRAARDDLISHLLSEGCDQTAILTECVTYLAAGVATTREFICAAAWQLLEHPELRARYRAGDARARQRILSEVLRLEPVIGALVRRTEAELALGAHTIPAGALVRVDLRRANRDARAVGACPAAALPERPVAPGVAPYALSFGHGHHRCPGAHLALQQTDIFLQQLLALDLRVRRPPSVSHDPATGGYELRRFEVSL